MKRENIQKILNSGFKASLVITGGGTGAINDLLKYGGGSKFLLSAEVPYSKSAFEELTGLDKDFVSPESCEKLAMAAFNKAESYCDSPDELHVPTIGISCTAKLTYDGEREGRDHEAIVGVAFKRFNNKDGDIKCYHVRVPVPSMNREAQEEWLSRYILDTIYLFTCTNYRHNI